MWKGKATENLDYPNISRGRVSGDRQPWGAMSWSYHRKTWLCPVAKQGTEGSRGWLRSAVPTERLHQGSLKGNTGLVHYSKRNQKTKVKLINRKDITTYQVTYPWRGSGSGWLYIQSIFCYFVFRKGFFICTCWSVVNHSAKTSDPVESWISTVGRK